MGILDRALESWDRKDEQGRYIVFPFGFLGRGRLVNGDEALQRLKQRYKWLLYAQLALALGAYVFFRNETGLFLLVILATGLVVTAIVYVMFRPYPISDAKPPGYFQSLKRIGYVYGRSTLWILCAMSLLLFTMTSCGLALAWPEMESENVLFGLIVSLGTLASSAFFGWLLWQRKNDVK